MMKSSLAAFGIAVAAGGCEDVTEQPGTACPTCVQQYLEVVKSDPAPVVATPFNVQTFQVLCPENSIVLGGGCSLDRPVLGVSLTFATPVEISGRAGYQCGWLSSEAAEEPLGRVQATCYLVPPCCR